MNRNTETIKTIRKVEGHGEPIKYYDGSDGVTTYDGYEITTSKQIIFVGIDNDQQCCEDWGYLMSEDDPTAFIGAELLAIKLTDTALDKQALSGNYSGEVMFVDLETNRGVLQFVVYNDHNGYYGHAAIVRSVQLNHDETL